MLPDSNFLNIYFRMISKHGKNSCKVERKKNSSKKQKLIILIIPHNHEESLFVESALFFRAFVSVASRCFSFFLLLFLSCKLYCHYYFISQRIPAANYFCSEGDYWTMFSSRILSKLVRTRIRRTK